MSRRRYAVVGAGSRSQMYVDAIAGEYAEHAELVAICEPNPVRAALAVQRAIDAGVPAPSTWHPDRLEELIRTERIDRVVITARDDLHAPLIVRALEAGVDVVVEKPLTIDAESAAAIEDAVQRTGGDVLLTFNYRYSPRNSALRQVIQDGLIGDVTSIDFQWMLDTKHGADYFRRWHREKKNSGGLLVHKASHHFDLVNWWIHSTPRRVYASGGKQRIGHIAKTGSPDLRWILQQAAWTAIRYDEHVKRIFLRIAKRAGRKAAAVAVARKLLTWMQIAVKKGEPYRTPGPRHMALPGAA